MLSVAAGLLDCQSVTCAPGADRDLLGFPYEEKKTLSSAHIKKSMRNKAQKLNGLKMSLGLCLTARAETLMG